MCSNFATKGKQIKQGLLGLGNNSKGLGIFGIDLLGKYGRGFEVFMCGIGFRVSHLKVLGKGI